MATQSTSSTRDTKSAVKRKHPPPTVMIPVLTPEQRALTRQLRIELNARCEAMLEEMRTMCAQLEAEYEQQIAQLPNVVREMSTAEFCRRYNGDVARAVADATAAARPALSVPSSSVEVVINSPRRIATATATAATVAGTEERRHPALPQTPQRPTVGRIVRRSVAGTPGAAADRRKRLTLMRREPSFVGAANAPATSDDADMLITVPLGADGMVELDPSVRPADLRNQMNAEERRELKARLAQMQAQLALFMQQMD